MLSRSHDEFEGFITICNVLEVFEFGYVCIYNIPSHLVVDQEEKHVVLLRHDIVNVFSHLGKLFLNAHLFTSN